MRLEQCNWLRTEWTSCIMILILSVPLSVVSLSPSWNLWLSIIKVEKRKITNELSKKTTLLAIKSCDWFFCSCLKRLTKIITPCSYTHTTHTDTDIHTHLHCTLNDAAAAVVIVSIASNELPHKMRAKTALNPRLCRLAPLCYSCRSTVARIAQLKNS